MKSYKKPVLAVILEEPRDRICSDNGNDNIASDPFDSPNYTGEDEI